MATNLRNPEAIYTFRFVGRYEDFYVYRAPIWPTINRNALDAQQFEGEIFGWLVENAKDKWYLSSFKDVDGYFPMPHASENGNTLCVALNVIDLINFENSFEVLQTPDIFND